MAIFLPYLVSSRKESKVFFMEEYKGSNIELDRSSINNYLNDYMFGFLLEVLITIHLTKTTMKAS